MFPLKSRLRNVFGPQAPTDRSNDRKIFGEQKIDRPIVNQDTVDNEEDTPIRAAGKKLMGLYSESSPANERYTKYLEEQPSEADYAPSRKRRLGGALAASLIGLSDPKLGQETADNIINGPFRNRLKDWERQKAPLAAAASAEKEDRTRNISALKTFIDSEHVAQMDRSLIQSRNDNATHQKTLETQAAANAKAAEDDRIRRDTDRTTDNTRQAARDKADEEYRKKTLAQGSERIGIARANSAISGRRASAYESSVNGLNTYRDHLKNKMTTLKGDTPAAQKTASELALHNIILTPGNSQRFANFYHVDEKGKISIDLPNKSMFDSEDDFNNDVIGYAGFKKEWDTEVAKVLAQQHPVAPDKINNTPPPKPENKKYEVTRRPVPASR